MSRILLILSVVFMLLSAVLGFMNKTHLSEARQATDTAKQETASTKSSLDKAKKDLTDANTKVTAAAAKATEDEQALATKDAALAKAATDVTNLNAQLTEKTSGLEVVQKELDDLKAAQAAPVNNGTPTPPDAGQLTELQAKVTSMEAENKVLGDKLAAAESKAADLNREIERRKQSVLAKGLEGEILAVNQAWGFVVLSLGDRNGVVANAEMVVMRDGDRVGKVKITSVEGTNSIADIVGNSVAGGQRIMPGDRVIYTGGN